MAAIIEVLTVLVGMIVVEWRKVLLGFIWVLFIGLGVIVLCLAEDSVPVGLVLFFLAAPCFYTWLYSRKATRKKPIVRTPVEENSANEVDVADETANCGNGSGRETENDKGERLPEGCTIEGDTLIFSGSALPKDLDTYLKHMTVRKLVLTGKIWKLTGTVLRWLEDLEEVILPTGVEFIDGAFAYCFRLRRIEIPESVIYVGDYSFNNCDELRAVVIHGKMTEIADLAFVSCPKALFYCHPNSAAERHFTRHGISFSPIGTETQHEELRRVKSCEWEDGVLTIRGGFVPSGFSEEDRDLFVRNVGMVHTIVTEGVLRIEEQSLWHLSRLEEVQLKDGIKSIGRCCFEGCEKLRRVEIAESLTFLGAGAFSDCKALETATIHSRKNLAVGEGTFEGCPKLQLYCHSSGAMEKYAKKAGLKMTFLDCDHEKNSIGEMDTRFKGLFWRCFALSAHQSVIRNSHLPFEDGYYVTEEEEVLRVRNQNIYYLGVDGWSYCPPYIELWYDSMKDFSDIPESIVKELKLDEYPEVPRKNNS